jgi:mRNA export factor
MSGNQNANNDLAVNSPPDDAIASISFSPTSNLFVAGSWNKQVRCWDVAQNGQTTPKAYIDHKAPVLCTAWSPDGSRVFSGSCDTTAKMWVLGTNQSGVIAQHAAPIKEIFYSAELNFVVTGSWDKTVKYWDPRTPTQAKATVQLPERCYAMDVKGQLVVVGTADRHVVVYDIRKPTVPFRTMQSPLKFQSRCLAAFPDASGFALGSIEGRVAIQHVEEKNSAKNFAFKCHRHSNEVYAVNSIAFHPRYGTFATAGSDGVYTFWDKDSKQRLKLFNRMDQSITCSAFNRDGSIYAYAVCYDWSKGIEYYDKRKPNSIYLHAVQDGEIVPRKKSR